MATKPKTAAARIAATGSEKKGRVYYIVNPAGAIHAVNYEQAKWRLALPGWRQATAEEVTALKDRGGNQVHDDPIAPRWSPEPAELPELDEAEAPRDE